MMTTRKKALEGKRKRKGPSILKNFVLTGMPKTARQTPSPPSSTKSSKGEKSSPTKKKDATNTPETNEKNNTPISNSRRKQQLGKKVEKSNTSSPTKVSESVLNFSDSTLKETLLAAVAANFNCEEFNEAPNDTDPVEEPPSSAIEEKQDACEADNPIVKEDEEQTVSETENVVKTVEKNEELNRSTNIDMQPKICLVPVKVDANKDRKYKIILSPQRRPSQEPVETAGLNLNTETTDRRFIKPITSNQRSSFNISRNINSDMVITQKQFSGSTQKIIINPTDSKTKGQLIPIKVVKKTETSTASSVPAASPPRTQVSASTSVANPPLFYIQSSQNNCSDMDLTALVQRNLPGILASLQKQQKVTLSRDALPNQCPELISIVPTTKLPTLSVENTIKELSVANTVKTSVCQPLYINTQRTDSLTVTASNKLITTPAVQLATKIGFDAETPSSSQMEGTLSCEETLSVSDMTEPTPSPPDGVGTPKPEEQSGIKLTAMPQGANILSSRPMLVNSASIPSTAALCFITQPRSHPIYVQAADAEKNIRKGRKPPPIVVKPKPDITELLRTIEMQKNEIARLRRRNETLEDWNGALQTKLKIIYQLPLNQQRQEELLLRILDQMPTLVTAAVSAPGGLDSTADNMILPPVSTLFNNEVHLGQGVWLAKPEYDKVMHSAVTPSLLVRNLAVAVYGDDVLKASTVLGKNNMKISEKGARPPLSPTRFSAIRDTFDYWLTRHGYAGQRKVDELSHTTHYLGSKIQDLRSDGFKSRQHRRRNKKCQSSEESSQEAGPSGVQKEVQQPSSESENQPAPNKVVKRKPSSPESGAQHSKKLMLQHPVVSSEEDESSEIEVPLTDKKAPVSSKSIQCLNTGTTQGAKNNPTNEKIDELGKAKEKALGVPPAIEEEFENWQDVCDEVARIKQEVKSEAEDEENRISTVAGIVQGFPHVTMPVSTTAGTVQSSSSSISTPGTVHKSSQDKVQAFLNSITKQIESEDA